MAAWSVLLVAELALVMVFGFTSPARIGVLVYAGYAAWLLSAFLGWWPIFYLKKKGGVARGKSYVHTTSLVTTGIYSIVRHPQYTAGIWFSLALALVSQHPAVIALGLAAAVLLYVDIRNTDRHEVEKFGEPYRAYMERVPRTNIFLGAIRRLARKGG